MSLIAILTKLGSLVMQANNLTQSLQPFVGQKPPTQTHETDAKIKKVQEDLKQAEEILAELSSTVEALAKELQLQIEIGRKNEEKLRTLGWVSFFALAFGLGALAFTFIK
jgi:Tfp pilus assembly protein PilF